LRRELHKTAVFLCSIIFFLVAASGCAPHSLTEPSPGRLPVSFIGAPADNGQVVAADRWWHDFHDPLLDRLMEEALAGNLDLRQAYARLEQLEAASRVADAGRWPAVNLEAQTGRSGQPAAGGTVAGSSQRLSLAAGFELDLWQKLKSKSDAARLDVLAGREEVQTLYLLLTSQLADRYYLAIEQRAQLSRLDTMIESWAETVSRVEERYRQGLAQPLDVNQARQSLAAARARRPVSEAALAETEHALALLLGRFPERNIAGDLAVLPAAPQAYPAGLPADLLQRRPDIKAAALRVRAMDERVGLALADRFPSFNLLADYGSSRSSFQMVLADSFWDVLFKAALPVLDAGRRQAEVDRSRAALKEEMHRYRQTILRALQEVEDALARNHATEQRLELLDDQLRHARASTGLATDTYFQGVAGYLPVLTAQRLQLEAETQLIGARRQLISDRISLIRALGGGVDNYELKIMN